MRYNLSVLANSPNEYFRGLLQSRRCSQNLKQAPQAPLIARQAVLLTFTGVVENSYLQWLEDRAGSANQISVLASALASLHPCL